MPPGVGLRAAGQWWAGPELPTKQYTLFQPSPMAGFFGVRELGTNLGFHLEAEED